MVRGGGLAPRRVRREPAHGVRLCAPALRADVPGLLARLAAEGCQAADSALLPGEFLRVPPGARLQALLGRYVTDTAACQVAGPSASLFLALPGSATRRLTGHGAGGQRIDVMGGTHQCHGT